ncbi:hypothetical protein C8R31_104304 [Nitrosospira sp. Nsp2]|nr:hypothetical protein C8R31_104304 [Nitrosospira sp. Nsp2]
MWQEFLSVSDIVVDMPRRKEKLAFAAHLNGKIEFDCIGGLFQELGKGKFEYRFRIDPHTSSPYCFWPWPALLLACFNPFPRGISLRTCCPHLLLAHHLISLLRYVDFLGCQL